MNETASPSVSVTNVIVEILINVPAERVWESMVLQTSEWWHEDFFTRPGLGKFHIEEKLGGMMYEDWGGGQGQIWGRVNGLMRPEFLQIAGDSDREWGGPSRGIMTFRIDEKDGGSRVRFEHSIFGHVSEQTKESLLSGWKLLFEGCLKPYAETGEVPGNVGASDCKK